MPVHITVSLDRILHILSDVQDMSCIHIVDWKIGNLCEILCLLSNYCVENMIMHSCLVWIELLHFMTSPLDFIFDRKFKISPR